jgi:hypothetical protein
MPLVGCLIGRRISLPCVSAPKILKTIGRQLGVAHRVLNVPMPHPGLNGPCVAPGVTRVAVLRDPAITAGTGQFAVIQAVAPAVGVEVRPIDVRHEAEIERAVAAFVNAANGGMIVTAAAAAATHRQSIVALAARYNCRRFISIAACLSPPAD